MPSRPYLTYCYTDNLLACVQNLCNIVQDIVQGWKK